MSRSFRQSHQRPKLTHNDNLSVRDEGHCSAHHIILMDVYGMPFVKVCWERRHVRAEKLFQQDPEPRLKL